MNTFHSDATIVYFLELSAEKYPHREFLICDEIRRTYKQVDARVNSLGNALLDIGVRKGDRVGSYLGNCPEIVENYLAANKIGAIPVPINFRLSGPEIAGILNHSKAKVLFLGKEFIPVMKSIRSELTSIQHFIVVGHGTNGGMLSSEDLIERNPSNHPGIHIGPDDYSMLMYTAGTTGFPKGVFTRHRSDIWAIMNSTWYDMVLGRVRPTDTMAYPLPLFHKAAYITVVSQMMKFGRCVIMRSFDPAELLRLIQEEKINLFAMVPAVANAILQVPDLQAYDLSSWNTVRCTGAPFPVALKKRFAQIFPQVDICDNYGMTEVPTISMHVTREKVTNALTAGKPHPFTEVKLLDDDDREVPPGEIGEVCVRSPALFSEYFENPKANEQAFYGGWFHTSDMGMFDDEGNLYIKDRKNDMIIAGGENIYPAEVEQVLFTHPKILEISCIGIPDERFGEAVMAVVVLKPGESMTEEEAIEYASEHLGKFKVPKRVAFVDQLPRSAVGKVLRRELRKQFGGITVKYD